MTEDQSSIENFSTFIENVKLPPGVYKILLKQSVSANHLVQMYSDLSICFPFSFYIEYTELQSSKINPLTSVNPSELTSYNSLQSLVLILTFLHPITGSVDSRNFYLNSEEIDEKVHPIYALRQESLQKDIRIKELNVEILEKEDHIDFLKSSLQSIDTELLMTLQSENTSLKKERESLASSLEAVTKKLDKISKQSSK